MCSRYFLDADGNIIAYTFRVPTVPSVRKRFNIAPTQSAPVVRLNREGGREIAMLRWGLIPFWAKDLKIGTTMINARSEGIDTKPAFREAMKARLRSWLRENPERREQLRENLQRWRNMNEQQREQLRERLRERRR